MMHINGVVWQPDVGDLEGDELRVEVCHGAEGHGKVDSPVRVFDSRGDSRERVSGVRRSKGT